MADLTPYPFDRLLTRMFDELDAQGSIFDLPRRKFVVGLGDKDASVRFHSRVASTPLGPAAGPQSQMAQNIVLAWLGGSRIIELKTVQILDELNIPRPCIDARNVGYNVEWSQELRLEQSLEEYVKAAMLIEILQASEKLDLAPGFDNVIFDMSVGYDLKGIQSAQVRAFIEGLMDARPTIERLRSRIPPRFAQFRDLDFKTDLCHSLTLSTFHGCPPDEIERIIDFLLHEYGLHCTIKLNPTLLGPERVRSILHDQLGYHHIHTPHAAFEQDATWEQVVAFVKTLKQTADRLELGLGVKFSNTLIVENPGDFLPASEREMYLSGQPLHVLAMHLVRDFRRTFGTSIPVSFSAGIDRHNFADAVALGLTPITVCTDLLRPGGYARQSAYFDALCKRMDRAHARSIEQFILSAYGHARKGLEQAGGVWTDQIESALKSGMDVRTLVDEALLARWVAAAIELNTEHYVKSLASDERYWQQSNASTPKKIGRRLQLFDCLTCDKCIPVCPNDANFALAVSPATIPVVTLEKDHQGGWHAREEGVLELTQRHQIANFADFCNECGNCDVFCPEDGGPYILKPRFFGSLDAWKLSPLDGFFARADETTATIHGRFEGREYVVSIARERAEYRGDSFSICFDPADPAATVTGEAEGAVDLTYFAILRELLKALFHPGAPVNWVNR